MHRLACITCVLLACCSGTAALTVRVAVASNFAPALAALAPDFERLSGHQIALSAGSTGKLYTQICQGAPFDVLLAADQAAPVRLIAQGLAVADSRYTYAQGKLVLWSMQPGLVDAQGLVLGRASFRHLAYATPETAPYGAAALQTLTRLGLKDALAARTVHGESLGQTYSFVASGNAELGFVALAQVYENGRLRRGSAWTVPAHLYEPLLQDAVLLRHGRENAAAAALLTHLKSPQTRAALRALGYDTP